MHIICEHIFQKAAISSCLSCDDKIFNKLDITFVLNSVIEYVMGGGGKAVKGPVQNASSLEIVGLSPLSHSLDI